MFMSQQKGYLEFTFTIGTWEDGIVLKFAKGWAEPENEKTAILFAMEPKLQDL